MVSNLLFLGMGFTKTIRKLLCTHKYIQNGTHMLISMTKDKLRSHVSIIFVGESHKQKFPCT